MGHLFPGDLHNYVAPLSYELLLFLGELGTAQRVRSIQILRHKSVFDFSSDVKKINSLLPRGKGDVEMNSLGALRRRTYAWLGGGRTARGRCQRKSSAHVLWRGLICRRPH